MHAWKQCRKSNASHKVAEHSKANCIAGQPHQTRQCTLYQHQMVIWILSSYAETSDQFYSFHPISEIDFQPLQSLVTKLESKKIAQILRSALSVQSTIPVIPCSFIRKYRFNCISLIKSISTAMWWMSNGEGSAA